MTLSDEAICELKQLLVTKYPTDANKRLNDQDVEELGMFFLTMY